MLAAQAADHVLQELDAGRVVVDMEHAPQLQALAVAGQGRVLGLGVVNGDAHDLLGRTGCSEEFCDCRILAVEYAGHWTVSFMVH
jgi:hypothetical protein